MLGIYYREGNLTKGPSDELKAIAKLSHNTVEDITNRVLIRSAWFAFLFINT